MHQNDKYKTINELILAIDDYINYYNYEKLKGLSNFCDSVQKRIFFFFLKYVKIGLCSRSLFG